MKKIATLIRMYKFELDEKRRALVAIEEQMQRTMDARLSLDKELVEEQKTAAQAIELGMTYHGYSKKFIQRREKMEQELEHLKIEVEKAELIVQMAYQELKKYEVTAERQEAREKLEATRKEQAEADDTSIAAFERKKQS